MSNPDPESPAAELQAPGTQASPEPRPLEPRQPLLPQQALLPPQALLIALTLMAALHFLLPLASINGSPWRWAGALPAALGLTLVLHSARVFDRVRTTIVPFHTSSALVTTVFFQVNRDPIYIGPISVGIALLPCGVAILSGSLSPLCAPPLFALSVDRRIIAAEERMLAARFGAACDAYRARVRRWL